MLTLTIKLIRRGPGEWIPVAVADGYEVYRGEIHTTAEEALARVQSSPQVRDVLAGRPPREIGR